MQPPMPRGPVLGWDCFKRPNPAEKSELDTFPSVELLPHKTYTTSGRAAIYHALRQLQLVSGRLVLLPTYHCPTMVAPVLLAGHQPSYYGIAANGLPNLDSITPDQARLAGAMLVPHYFGIPHSLAEVRRWCDEHHIALIEDCAHTLFGRAGERNVGAWGDFATASLSKFLPVPEAGLLASGQRPIAPLNLQEQGTKAHTKGCLDIVEMAIVHERLTGLNTIGNAILNIKLAIKRILRGKNTTPTASSNCRPESGDFMPACDMARINFAPLGISLWLTRKLTRHNIIRRRRENFLLYAQLLNNQSGCRPLMPDSNTLSDQCIAPYVFPLWVDDADRVYHELRLHGYPVFRWDRIWPGTPIISGDAGQQWSRHVLQLLCHQDLQELDIKKTAAAIQHILN